MWANPQAPEPTRKNRLKCRRGVIHAGSRCRRRNRDTRPTSGSVNAMTHAAGMHRRYRRALRAARRLCPAPAAPWSRMSVRDALGTFSGKRGGASSSLDDEGIPIPSRVRLCCVSGRVAVRALRWLAAGLTRDGRRDPRGRLIRPPRSHLLQTAFVIAGASEGSQVARAGFGAPRTTHDPLLSPSEGSATVPLPIRRQVMPTQRVDGPSGRPRGVSRSTRAPGAGPSGGAGRVLHLRGVLAGPRGRVHPRPVILRALGNLHVLRLTDSRL